jgi:hypothetical protein
MHAGLNGLDVTAAVDQQRGEVVPQAMDETA